MVSASALCFQARNRDQISDPSLSPHWGFWATLFWSSLILIAFSVTNVLVIIIQLTSSRDMYSWLEFATKLQSLAYNGNTLAYSALASTLEGCSLIAGIIKLKKRATAKDYLGLHRVPIQTAALWLGITLGFIVFLTFILHSLGEPRFQQWFFDVYTTAHPVWLLWIALLVCAPLFEEMFFRGFMFRGFQSSFLGLFGTILVTSGLWAVVHLQYDFYVMIGIGCFGVLLAIARQMTGSLLMPLYLHAFFNLCGTVGVAISQFSH